MAALKKIDAHKWEGKGKRSVFYRSVVVVRVHGGKRVAKVISRLQIVVLAFIFEAIDTFESILSAIGSASCLAPYRGAIFHTRVYHSVTSLPNTHPLVSHFEIY